MAFTITIDKGTIVHTRPYGFHGVHRHPVNNHADNTQLGYLQSVRALGPEHLRADTSSLGVNAGGGVYVDDMKALALDLAQQCGTWTLAKIRGTIPGNSTSVNITSDTGAQNPAAIGNNTTGWSPKNVVDVVDDWIASGITVKWFAHINEIANQEKVYFGGIGDRAQTWATMIERKYADELASRFPNLMFMTAEHTEGRAAGTNTGQPYRDIDSYLEKGLRATTSWPYSTTNAANGHQEIYGSHGYCKQDFQSGASVAQLGLNSIFFGTNPGDPVASGQGRLSLQVVKNIRERLDSHGLNAVPIAITEYAIDEGDLSLATWGPQMPLADILGYIEALNLCRTHNLQMLTLHNITPKGTPESMFMGRNPWTLSVRGTTYRDMIRKFFDNAFDIPSVSVTGTAKTAGTNATTRVKANALVNEAGTELRLMVANADLTNAETVNHDLGFTPGSGGTRIALTQNLGDSDSPTVSSVSALSTRTGSFSLPAGAAYLFIVPIPMGSAVDVSLAPDTAVLDLRAQAPAVEGATPLPEVLAADFNDDLTDESNPEHTVDAESDTMAVSVGGGVCEITIPAGEVGTAAFRSSIRHTLISSVLQWKWESSVSLTGVLDFGRVEANATHYLYLGIEAGVLKAVRCDADLNGGVEEILGSVTFDEDAMVYGRIREEGGTVYWEYAADISVTDWTVLASETKKFALTQVLLSKGLTVSSAQASDVVGSFKNLNRRPNSFASKKVSF